MHKIMQNAPRKKGFTLIEVLITLVILVVVFFPLLQIISRALIASGESENTIIAMSLARAKIENIKNLDFVSIGAEGRSAVPNFSAFEREVIVNSLYNELKEVETIVYWQSTDGSELNVSLITLITSYL